MTYSITLKQTDGTVDTFECDADTTILDALEEAGFDHDYSCRAGACSSCCMKIEGDGTVNQEEQSFLDEEQMEDGFAMLCVTTPESDCVIQTEVEDEL